MVRALLSVLVLLFLPLHSMTAADRAARVEARIGERLRQALVEQGLGYGAPVHLRIYKEERVLEVYVDDGTRFRRFKSYPICAWSGTLGPKRREGDGQAPEGFYWVRAEQLNPASRFHLSFDLGFPNAYERAQGWTGSYLMVHGACVSIGCYAMTDPAIEEIYTLIAAALRQGQRAVPVHVFPFRMPAHADVDARIANSPWADFWGQLAAGHRRFDERGRPPDWRVARGRYHFD